MHSLTFFVYRIAGHSPLRMLHIDFPKSSVISWGLEHFIGTSTLMHILNHVGIFFIPSPFYSSPSCEGLINVNHKYAMSLPNWHMWSESLWFNIQCPCSCKWCSLHTSIMSYALFSQESKETIIDMSWAQITQTYLILIIKFSVSNMVSNNQTNK